VVKSAITNGVRRFYEFGPFRLDPNRHRLLRDGEVVPLSPKAIQTLTVLVQNPGKLLERETLRDALWPDTIVEDANLTVAISQLRKALNQNGDTGEFIQTIPRVGYRFVADLREMIEEPAPLTIEEPARLRTTIRNGNGVREENAGTEALAAETRSTMAAQARRSSGTWAIVTVLFLALAAIAFFIHPLRSRHAEPALRPAKPKTMAVLPLKVLRADPGDEYLGIGLVDALITQIGRISQILVRPTGAVQKYAESQVQDPLAAGRELRVEAVLDGTVQREADNLRMTLRLLRVSDGTALWSGKFDKKFTDVFAVQDSISQAVAKALIRNLNGEDRKLLTERHTDNTEAFRAYLKGRYFWNKRTPTGLKQSVAHFRQAIDLDPAYALAYSGLADCYAVLGWYGNHSFDDTFPKAKALAEKALEIDSSLADPHATLGLALHSYYSAWARAENEYKRALELNPNYATAHHWYGWYLIQVGRRDESVQEMKRALELDPLSLQINTDLGAVLLDAYRPDEAIRYLKAALEMDQDFAEAHFGLGLAYLQKGDFEQSITELERARELSHDRPDVLSHLGNAYALAGQTTKAMSILAQLNAMPKQNNVSPYHLAVVFLGLGEKEKALAALEAAASQGQSGFLTGLKAEPTFDPLRYEPRFQNVLISIGLMP
jgi:DNA-binding winged helix-turn-helix (wHTH) protein/TolB-like protein/Tfp pilus assembly protein PilF